jgi:hypothetical protein
MYDKKVKHSVVGIQLQNSNMKIKKLLILLLAITAFGFIGYFFGTMKYFADGVIEDSKRIEELKKSGDFNEPIIISEDPPNQIISDSTDLETADVKEWLTGTIKKYFEDNQIHFREITTKQYAEYKQDAINVDYGNTPITLKQFKEKWTDIYDISYAGIGESFLLGQQDWGIVVMSKCDLISVENNKKFTFDTTISDTTFKHTYSIEITIVQTDDGFKIDDVKKTEVTDANKR